MKFVRNIFYFALAATLLNFAASSCKKTDEPGEPDKDYKEISLDIDDYSNYSKWTYVNLKTGETETHRDFTAWNYFEKQKDPKDPKKKIKVKFKDTPAQGNISDVKIEWHLAFHRYDVRTNNGSVVLLEAASIKETEGKALPTDGFTQDEKVVDVIETDMSDMRKGKIGYSAGVEINKVMYEWINRVETHSMPPVKYSLASKKVFVLKHSDGSLFKVRFTDCFDKSGKKKVVTFKYLAL